MDDEVSALELYSKGNEAFVDEDYKVAIEYYSQAIEIDESRAEYYNTRSNGYFKLKKYKECIQDIDKAVELGLSLPKLYLRKGISCYHLGQYEEAKSAFSLGKECEETVDSEFENWIAKCEERLRSKVSAVPQASPAQLAPFKIRHTWYQTEPTVIVEVLVKKAKKEDVDVKLTENALMCHVNLENNDKYLLDVILAHEIVPTQSTWQILPSKIEFKLKKVEGIQWTTLENTGEPKVKFLLTAPPPPDKTNLSHTYPSSSVKKKDWDKIVDEIKKDEASETPEGEAAVNQLFQKIYSEGSDDVRRAMNKSFTESGGTVLSTNWKDVGEKRIDIKPPEGMEWKNWEI